MKILFVGIFDNPTSDNIPMKKALEELGHVVTSFDYRTPFVEKGLTPGWLKFIIIKLRYYRFPKYLRKLIYSLPEAKHVRNKLLSLYHSDKFDLVFIRKADYLPPNTLNILRKESKIYYFFMDWQKTADTILANEFVKRSHFASATMPSETAAFKKVNPNSHQVLQAIDENQFYPPRTKTKKRYDCLFVGEVTPYRKSILDEIESQGITIQIFGPNTPNGPIFTQNLCEVHHHSKIVLNLSRSESTNTFSLRVFQIMGSGAFMLSQHSPILEETFGNFECLDTFRSSDEAVEKIKFYLSHSEERELRAKRGLSVVQEQYTWTKAMNKIIGIVEHRQ